MLVKQQLLHKYGDISIWNFNSIPTKQCHCPRISASLIHLSPSLTYLPKTYLQIILRSPSRIFEVGILH
jgi:hypothetical protein